jgi:uncharacterized metal-binding protein
MISDKNFNLNNFAFRSKSSSKKKKLEGVTDFRKNKIEDAFVEVDYQLIAIASCKNMEQVRRHIPNIRAQMFELYNYCVHGLNIREFASHQPDDKTPLDSESC